MDCPFPPHVLNERPSDQPADGPTPGPPERRSPAAPARPARRSHRSPGRSGAPPLLKAEGRAEVSTPARASCFCLRSSLLDRTHQPCFCLRYPVCAGLRLPFLRSLCLDRKPHNPPRRMSWAARLSGAEGSQSFGNCRGLLQTTPDGNKVGLLVATGTAKK